MFVLYFLPKLGLAVLQFYNAIYFGHNIMTQNRCLVCNLSKLLLPTDKYTYYLQSDIF